MPPETKTARWKKVVGYVGFSLAALVFCLYLTFPYEALRQRVQREADARGLFLKMSRMGPGLFGVTATNVQLSQKAARADAPPDALVLQSVALRPSLFPPGVAVRAKALGGTIRGAIGPLGTVRVRLTADDLNFSQGNLKAFTGVDLAGRGDAELSLNIPQVTLAGSKVSEPDLGQASGTLSLKLQQLQINGGTVKVAIPMYGPEPTPIDLPKIGIGDVEGAVKIDKGVATLEKLDGKGQGLDVKGSGTVKLAKRVEYSEASLELRLKTDPEWVKQLGVYGVGLSTLRSDPKDPTWKLATLSGYLSRPSFR